MLLQEIIDLAKSYLNLKDFNETGLTAASNIAVKRIVSNYITAKRVDEIKVANKRINLLDFTKKPLEILKITKNNIPLEFKVYTTFIEVSECDKCDVEYSYIPENYNLKDEVIELAKLPVHLPAYLTAYEYLTMYGNYEDAVIFEKKFIDEINSLKKTSKSVVLKKRNWFF